MTAKAPETPSAIPFATAWATVFSGACLNHLVNGWFCVPGKSSQNRPANSWFALAIAIFYQNFFPSLQALNLFFECGLQSVNKLYKRFGQPLFYAGKTLGRSIIVRCEKQRGLSCCRNVSYSIFMKILCLL